MSKNFIFGCGSNEKNRLTINSGETFHQMQYLENLSLYSVSNIICTKSLSFILMNNGDLLCFGFEKEFELVLGEIARIVGGESHIAIQQKYTHDVYIMFEKEILGLEDGKYSFDCIFEGHVISEKNNFENSALIDSSNNLEHTFNSTYSFSSLSDSLNTVNICNHTILMTETGYKLHNIFKNNIIENRIWSTSSAIFIETNHPREIWSFGEKNQYGQLGLLPWEDRIRPYDRRNCNTSFLKKKEFITSIKGGIEHTILLTNQGRVFTCGSNAFGQRGLFFSSSDKISFKDRFSPIIFIELNLFDYISKTGNLKQLEKRYNTNNEDTTISDELTFDNIFNKTYTFQETETVYPSFSKETIDSSQINLDSNNNTNLNKRTTLKDFNDLDKFSFQIENKFNNNQNNYYNNEYIRNIKDNQLESCLISEISCGSYNTILIAKNRHFVWVFGRNHFNQLSLDSSIWFHHKLTKEIRIPIRVKFDYSVQSVHCGFNQTFIVMNDSTNSIYATGYNLDWQLGLDTWENSKSLNKILFPPNVPFMSSVVSKEFHLGIGSKHTLILVKY